MAGLALSILLTVIIAICLGIWKMAAVIGIAPTLFCIAGGVAMMILDHILDHPHDSK